MTELRDVTARRMTRAVLASDRPSARSIATVSVIGPLWAAALGLVVIGIPIVALWAFTGGSSWTDAMSVAGVAWIVAHAVPFSFGTTTYSLLPLGLLIIPMGLLWHSGRWAARSARINTRGNALITVVLASVIYAIAVGLVAALAKPTELSVITTRAAVTAFVLSLLAFGAGVLRDSGQFASFWRETSDELRFGLRACAIALAGLVFVGAVLVTAGLVFSWSTVLSISESLNPGLIGGAALLLLQVAYLPVLVVWAVAYAAGSGIALGPALVISPFAPMGASTDLPPLPLLAALPTSSSVLAWFLPLAIIAVGVLAGSSIARWRTVWWRRATVGLLTGVVTGVVTGVAAAAANGALGDVRLAAIGPQPLITAGVVAGLIAIGAVAGSSWVRDGREYGQPRASRRRFGLRIGNAASSSD